MKNWREAVVGPEISILQAMAVIDKGAMQIAIVVDAEGRLIGTVSDGDVRRGILKGISLESSVSQIMTTTPVSMVSGASKEGLKELMNKLEILQIPIVDVAGKLIGLELWQDIIQHAPKHNPVVLMAGGAGRRLGQLTESCPKPLLIVGDKPILQTIMETFIENGFHDFYLSVNYRADMIEKYFGNGEKWGVQIQYLKERTPMGTAGSLKLMNPKPSQPFIVMNGDILTKINFEQLLNFHQTSQSSATMCIREYKSQIPYGVVQIDQHRLVAIQEKPVQQYFVSAGIYVFDSGVFDLLPQKSRLDMPELFQIVMEKKLQTMVFPIREYWIDIGHVDDYEKANGDYATFFK